MSSLAALPSSAPSPRRWTWWVGTVAAFFLGGVLLFAVYAKVLDPNAFVEQIRTEGLFTRFLSPSTAALIALAIEGVLGLALVLGIRRLPILIPATLLVAFFVFLTGRTYWLTAHGLIKPAANCGCFGNLVERTPSEAFWQDLALLVPPLLLSFLGRSRAPRPAPRLRMAAVALGTAGAVAFATQSPRLPLDDLATRLHPGVQIGDLCAGRGDERACLTTAVAGLDQGKNLVVLADLEDSKLTTSIDALNAFSRAEGNPTLWVLSASPSEQQRAFFWKWGPVFNVREVPSALLRPLYRQLPRSFLVEDGKVVRTYAGLPPLNLTVAQLPSLPE
jgi:uncharacterized membrane protein YphA (DoxX/SURF4 family)